MIINTTCVSVRRSGKDQRRSMSALNRLWRCVNLRCTAAKKKIARRDASGNIEYQLRPEGAWDYLPPLQGGVGFFTTYQKLRIWLLSLRSFAAEDLVFWHRHLRRWYWSALTCT